MIYHRRVPAAGDEIVAASRDARETAGSLSREEVQRTLESLSSSAGEGDSKAFTEKLRSAAPALLQYLESLTLDEAPPRGTQAYAADAFARFLHTLEMLPLPLSGRVLEIGANPYFLHILLRKLFPGAEIEGMNFFEHDVYSEKIGRAVQRIVSEWMGELHSFDYPTFNLETVHPYPYPPAHFDLILFSETLAHLVVNPLRVFRELRRILRPGGTLLVTTPNALRLANVAAILAGRNVHDLYWTGNGVHGRHNREFSLAEVANLLEGDGYEIVRAETRDRFDYDRVPIEAADYAAPQAALPFTKTRLLGWIEKAGGSRVDRGDNIYVVCRRAAKGEATLAGGSNGSELPGGAPPPAPDSRRLLTFLDRLEETGAGVTATGWAFLTDDDTGRPAELDLVLRDDHCGIAQRCSPMGRPDVARAHGLEVDLVGFHAEMRKAALPPGRYRLCLRIRSARGAVAERPLGEEILVGGGETGGLEDRNLDSRPRESGPSEEPSRGLGADWTGERF